MMLTNRQLLILQLIIQLYTETLEPVGSKKLMEVAELPFSSATIRNEMMKLEEMGYLERTILLLGEFLLIKDIVTISTNIYLDKSNLFLLAFEIKFVKFSNSQH